MRLLLDTHAFLWWVLNDRRLSQAARQMIADDDNDVLVSAASAWEITTKHRTGKLPEAGPLADNMIESIALEGFEELPITVATAARAGALPGPLRDPFDRMLIAQALSRNLVLCLPIDTTKYGSHGQSNWKPRFNRKWYRSTDRGV